MTNYTYLSSPVNFVNPTNKHLLCQNRWTAVCSNHFLKVILLSPNSHSHMGQSVWWSGSLAQLNGRVAEPIKNRMYYQLMKELFPAEWLPIIITVIFFLGGRSRTPRLLAIFTRPENTHTHVHMRWGGDVVICGIITIQF